MKRAMKQATVTRAGNAGLVLLALGTFGSVTFSQGATRDLQAAVAVANACKDAALRVSASSALLTDKVREYSVMFDPADLETLGLRPTLLRRLRRRDARSDAPCRSGRFVVRPR